MPTELAIGYIQAAHSIHGEVFLRFEGDPKLLVPGTEITLKSRDSIENKMELIASRPHKKGYILELAGIDTRNQAEEIIGSEFILASEDLVSAKGARPYLNELLGFKICLGNSQESMGEIVRFDSNGVQDLAVVKGANGEFVFPLVEQLVLAIDYEAKALSIVPVEGITEISP